MLDLKRACGGAALCVRHAASLAYGECGRSMGSLDVLNAIGKAFKDLFEK